MPYKTLIEDAQILEQIGEILADDGSLVAYEHKSVIYPERGTIIADEHVSPVVQKAYDEKDPHIRRVLRKLTAAQAAKLLQEDKDEEEEE